MELPTYQRGACLKQLLNYFEHEARRPLDNTLDYWIRFVEKYFHPSVKMRSCRAQVEANGVRQVGWHCRLCGYTPRKCKEGTYNDIPKMMKTLYDTVLTMSTVEVDLINESVLPTGQIKLDLGSVIREFVTEKLRSVREVQMRLIFTSDLKIISWEFCHLSKKEFVPKESLRPQILKLVRTVESFGNMTAGNTSSGAGASTEELCECWNKIAEGVLELAKTTL